MGRAPCCDKMSVKRGPWSPEEDAKLKAYIEEHGTGGNWIALPHKIGLKRCGKSCRLRWLNYLRPNIKHGGFSEEEDRIICNLYISIGSRWSLIAAQLPGRTDNDIKNYWNTKLKKKLLGSCRRESTQSSRLSSFEQGQQNSSQKLSSSALERIHLHLQLQGLNYPLLWPNLQNKINDQTINGAATPPLTSSEQAIVTNEFASLTINNSNINNEINDLIIQGNNEMECLKGSNGVNEGLLSGWWGSNGFDPERLSSSNSWDSASADLQNELLFNGYELDYYYL